MILRCFDILIRRLPALVWLIAPCLFCTCSSPKAVSVGAATKVAALPVIQDIALDQLGQLYVVTAANTVTQYRSDGSSGFQYNNNTLGRLALIDPSNPFTILLYYPDFQTIILLDRTLNEKTRIRLSELELLDIRLVALSNDNFIWLYDAADTQLKKLDQQGNTGFRSDRLDLLFQQRTAPDQLLADHNRIILNAPEKGILVFDQYGRYENTLPVREAQSLQMPDDNNLIYMRGDTVFAYDLRAFRESPLDLGITCPAGCTFRVGKEKIYWLEKGILHQKDL